jgi:hypothetical protein
MDALVGGEVQGKLSAVATLPSLRAKPQKAGGEDLADLGEPLGGAHQVGVEGVAQNRYRGRDDAEDKRGWLKRTMMSDS